MIDQRGTGGDQLLATLGKLEVDQRLLVAKFHGRKKPRIAATQPSKQLAIDAVRRFP